MTNLYHVFYKMPVLRKEDMYIELEEIAEKFVKSGLLRIEAEPKQNFVRFSIPSRNVHINFSKREIYEESLRPRITKAIKKALKESGKSTDLDNKVIHEIEKLKDQLKRFVEVEPELEMKIARILIQSAHPVVPLMIMLEEVEVFVSYGHSIGEVMDVASWRQAGSNSGMQSTDGKNVAIFVSCGGDPLFVDPPLSKEEMKAKKAREANEGEKEEKTHGDGKPALARLMGIAGQEIGHYSDIVRNERGQQVTRISANFSGTKADPQVNLARKTDMKNIYTYIDLLGKIGLSDLLDKEKEIRFQRRNPKKTVGYYFKLMMLKLARMKFIKKAKEINFLPITELEKNEYLGFSFHDLASDMLFNLEPKADVYSNSDKNIEEAIACIEALARVPQQANKWGHQHTKFFWRNLYKIYYNKLIPSCIRDYENMSGQKFTAYPNRLHKYTWKEKIQFRIDEFKDKVIKYFTPPKR